MKIYLIAGLVIVAAASTVSAQTISAPINGRPSQKPREKAPAPISKRAVGGAIPRGIRGGNLLQMLNPRAPARYGNSEDSLTYDPNDPAKWRGIKFFEFRF